MMTLRVRPLAIGACALIGACGGASLAAPLRSSTHATVDATVQFLSLEGGCWTLEVSQDGYYLPLNLPDSFRRDGLSVRADLLRRDDYNSVCMVGPVVEVLSIQAR
jgi:hypothetical protein